MSGALCIDFGTSSLRAVRRLPAGRLKPLPIGSATRSQLDDASIRSEVHVDSTGKHVSFGEIAVRRWTKERGGLLYELSPKLWLREPAMLGASLPDTLLTREDLLIGLLANAIRASADADGIGSDTLRKLDLRIAHPVWQGQSGEAATAALVRLASKAKELAFQRDWTTVTAGTLKDWAASDFPIRRPVVDVVEPVAAAIELMPYEENLIRLCAIVDVGAGTTDIGIFKSLVPDPDSSKPSRLVPLGPARSVFKAGNDIDALVLELILKRSGRAADAVRTADLRGRIRQVKEALFEHGYVQELGVDLQLEDVEGHATAKTMASAIRAELAAALSACEREVALLMRRTAGAVQHLDLVLAGGGARIGFLRRALSQPLTLGGIPLKAALVDVAERNGVDTHGAGRSRMAVALGGANVEYDGLMTSDPQQKVYRRGSY